MPRPARTPRLEPSITPSADMARLLDHLSALLDDGVDLGAGFRRVAAGWRVAIPDCVGVSLAVHHNAGSPVLVLTDNPGLVPGTAASSVSIPLAGAGGLSAVLHLDASTPLAFAPLLAGAGPVLAGAARGTGVRPGAVELAADAVRNRAIGMLLHRYGGSPEQAGERLHGLADGSGRTVAEVAVEMLAAPHRAIDPVDGP
jgi:hypothetical protein